MDYNKNARLTAWRREQMAKRGAVHASLAAWIRSRPSISQMTGVGRPAALAILEMAGGVRQRNFTGVHLGGLGALVPTTSVLIFLDEEDSDDRIGRAYS